MVLSCLRRPLAISFALHALLFLILLKGLGPVPARSKPVWIEVEAVPALRPKSRVADASRNRIVQTRSEQPAREAPKDAFLGERNQVVERQTVSRDQVTRMGDQARASSQPKSPKTRTAQKFPSMTPAASLSHLGVPIPEPRSQTLSPEEQLALERQPDRNGRGTPQDYVRGLRGAETTALNTREFIFFGYFQRIRGSLDRAWNEVLRDQLDRYYRKGRQLAANTEHMTRTLVTLDSAGEVVRVQVIEASGTQDLDQAAISAFNRAGPFPNPPKGLLDSAGRIQIRWDFVVRT